MRSSALASLFKYEGRRTRLLSRAEAAIALTLERIPKKVKKRNNQTIDEKEAVVTDPNVSVKNREKETSSGEESGDGDKSRYLPSQSSIRYAGIQGTR